MTDVNLVSVSNQEAQTINVEISNLSNSVDIEFGQNIAAALNSHNVNSSSHSYILERLEEKVDKETGKGLSHNDFTDELKTTYNNYQNSISELQTDISEIEENLSTIENSIPEIATETQAVSGIDDTTIMTPLKVFQSIQEHTQNVQTYIIETYTNNASGYRIWSDGYCEQWGISVIPSTSYVRVSLLKTFANTSYSVLSTAIGTNEVAYDSHVDSKTTTTFLLRSAESESHSCQWKASGYLAQGQY